MRGATRRKLRQELAIQKSLHHSDRLNELKWMGLREHTRQLARAEKELRRRTEPLQSSYAHNASALTHALAVRPVSPDIVLEMHARAHTSNSAKRPHTHSGAYPIPGRVFKAENEEYIKHVVQKRASTASTPTRDPHTRLRNSYIPNPLDAVESEAKVRPFSSHSPVRTSERARVEHAMSATMRQAKAQAQSSDSADLGNGFGYSGQSLSTQTFQHTQVGV